MMCSALKKVQKREEEHRRNFQREKTIFLSKLSKTEQEAFKHNVSTKEFNQERINSKKSMKLNQNLIILILKSF
jgi:hypothetical protein